MKKLKAIITTYDELKEIDMSIYKNYDKYALTTSYPNGIDAPILYRLIPDPKELKRLEKGEMTEETFHYYFQANLDNLNRLGLIQDTIDRITKDAEDGEIVEVLFLVKDESDLYVQMIVVLLETLGVDMMYFNKVDDNGTIDAI